MPVPNRPNLRWSLDFVSDIFGASRKFRILAVIYDCTRENLAQIADTSLSGAQVARELTALIRIYGKPGCVASDNGTEFTSTAILKWAGDTGVAWHHIEPGKPQQKRAGRLSNLRALRPARLRRPKPTTIKPKDSRYGQGTTGGQARGRSVEL